MMLRLARFLVLVLLMTPIVAQGQVDTATLNGTVLDAKSAAIAGAKITLRNIDTGQERTTTSGSDGTFTVTALPAGNYDLTIEASGFARAVRKAVVLSVGSATTETITLQVASLSQQEIVQAEAVQIDVTRSTIEGLVNEKSIEELPLNGRNFTELTFLLPGNSVAPAFDPTKARAVEVSSLGNLGRGEVRRRSALAAFALLEKLAKS